MAILQPASETIVDLLSQLKVIAGEQHCLTSEADKAPFLRDWRNLHDSQAQIVVRPGSAAEVARVVATCSSFGTAIVPQGGNTGLVGGSVAPGNRLSVVLVSLSRLNRVRDIDAANMTMTVEAGCTLMEAKQAAERAGCLLPITLASEGSCQIGGILSTNAGGNNVFRYGSSRDRALGLEVVLPDGQLWNGLRRLRKDNSGYRLRDLFLGAEGTLGIITAAVLALEPQPAARISALASAASIEACVEFAGFLRRRLGTAMIACELLPKRGIQFVLRHVPGTRAPFATLSDWSVILECADHRDEEHLKDDLETALLAASDQGLIRDCVVSASSSQAAKLWRLREEMPEAQRFEGGSIKHDVAVPVSQVANFIRAAVAAVEKELPGIRPVPFGHLCDGNIHFNLSQPADMAERDFLLRWADFDRIVHDLAASFDGTFAAEHGIGLLKLQDMRHYKAEIELNLMRRIKLALDPNDLMNPGKILPAAVA